MRLQARRVLESAVLLFFCHSLSMAAQAPSAKDLLGTWTLREFYLIGPDGKTKPWCEHYSGLLTYTEQGYMAVGINCLSASAPYQPVNDPKEMVFYAGTYEVRGGNTVVHKVLNSSDVSRIRKDQERHFRLSGKTLTLTGQGVKGPVKLVWERL